MDSPDTTIFSDVFAASAIGIAVENLEGQPLFVNPALCSMLGFSEEEMRGKHCVDFSPLEDAEKDWTLFQQLRAGSIEHYQLEKRYFRRDGSLVWGRLSLSLLNHRPSPLVIAMVEDITEQKKAEEAQFRLAAIVESSEDAIVSVTLDGIIVSWNAGAQRMYGYTEAEAIGKPVTILVPPELPNEENNIRETLKAGGRIEHFETVRVTKSGKKINVSLSVCPIKDSSGRIVGTSGIARDITERKRAEEALRESEEWLRLAIQTGKMYAYEWDVTTGVLVRSPEYASVLGATEPRTLTHNQVLEKVHPDDRPKLLAAVASHSPQKPTAEVTYRLLLPGKSPVWVKSSGRAFFDGEGRMLRVVGIVADITDQKLAEESLRASEERLRLAQKVAGIGTFERNIRTGVNTWTAEMESMYGLAPGGFTQTRTAFENLVHTGDRAEVVKLVDRALKTGEPTSGEWRVIWPDGSVHWITGRWQLLMDESGEPSRVVGVNMDVTERKRAEEALRESEEKFRNVFRDAGVGMVIVSPEGRFLAANKAFCDSLGYTEEELLEKTVKSLTFPEDWPAFSKKLREALTEGHGFQWFKKRCLHKSGRIVYTESSASLIQGREGHPYFVGEVLDVTNRKQAEEALTEMTRRFIESQEQERARIGRELHDDINQRLAMLAVELEELQHDPSGFHTRLQESRERLIEISRDVQALSHDLHSSKLQYLGVVGGIKSWCREFAERQRIEIDFQSDVPSHLPLEVGLPLFRVVQEALNNAVKHSGAKRIEVQLGVDSREIHLTVRDLGKGFDTEAAMQGDGHGLISMRERVRLVNGTIAIDSKPMAGTSIHVHIPLKSEHNPQAQAG